MSPKSEIQAEPIVNLWNRSMSITATCAMAAMKENLLVGETSENYDNLPPNRSGR